MDRSTDPLPLALVLLVWGSVTASVFILLGVLSVYGGLL